MASLKKYQEMRDFSKTKEPEGVVVKEHKGAHARGARFLVQKHAASHLHYDFRLEIDGVLKSWAIPKGPSLDPSHKRLAMEVEDHPVAYGTFEGTIPQGQYGGGTVLMWDQGTFEIDKERSKDGGDPLKEWKAGRLHIVLHGEKLKGAFRLMRMPKKDNDRSTPWLLIKATDEHAQKDGDVDHLSNLSVKTGRSMEEIAGTKDTVWRSNRDEKQPAKKKAAAKTTKTTKKKKKKTATATAQPTTVEGVTISNPERRVFGDDTAITKRDLARYFEAMAPLLLPHVEGRPLSVVRCPNGIAKGIAARGRGFGTGQCFYQKHLGKGMPEAIASLDVDGDDEQWLMVEDAAGLVSLVQMGVIEVHAWGCRPYAPEQPDRIVMDLDPGEGLAWSRVSEAAKEVRQRLADAGLESFLKSTGGKGLHVCAPLDGKASWDEVKDFCRRLAEDMERDAPDLYTSNIRKAERKDRLFVDYLRNGRGSTAIAPWCVRARPGAPVSVPMRWDELDKLPTWTMLNLHERVKKKDPWESWFDIKQTIGKRRRSRGEARA